MSECDPVWGGAQEGTAPACLSRLTSGRRKRKIVAFALEYEKVQTSAGSCQAKEMWRGTPAQRRRRRGPWNHDCCKLFSHGSANAPGNGRQRDTAHDLRETGRWWKQTENFRSLSPCR